MEDQEKTKWPGVLREYFSAIISIISFWAIALFWNVVFVELETVPRLGLGAALSWVVFIHAEVMGMILMSMMRRRLRAEARAEGRTEGRAEGRTEGLVEGRTEGRAEGRTEGLAEGRAEGRREAEAEVREAREIIRDLERQLREARGEGTNGA